jgi:hypothetical protein
LFFNLQVKVSEDLYSYKVIFKKKVKQSRYKPWRRLGEEELLPIHDLGTRRG